MHALIKDGSILRYTHFSGDPPQLAASKGVWVTVTEDPDPVYDPRIEAVVTQTTVSENSVSITKSVTARDLTAVQAELIARLKAETSAAILSAAPDYKQRNAALGGIYTPEQDEAIRNIIRTNRDACNIKEAAILAAGTAQDALAILHPS